MPLEAIYVVRHGFRTTWLVDPIKGTYTSSIPSPTGIPADPALTSHGVAQARELGHHLMTLDPPIQAVYSSPYYRCLQTITPFIELKQEKLRSAPEKSDRTAKSIRPEYGICEWFGSAPFDHPVPAPPGVLRSMFPAYDSSYVSALSPSRRGETVDELYERVRVAAQAIIDRCDSEGRRAVVLCTHAAVVIALGRVLTGCIPDDVETEDFRAFTCGLSVYRRRQMRETAGESSGQVTRAHSVSYLTDKEDIEDGPGESESQSTAVGGWECELNSDCSFLSSGEERGW